MRSVGFHNQLSICCPLRASAGGIVGMRPPWPTNRQLIMKTNTSHLWQAGKNPVKELLKKGQPVVGVVISVNSVEAATQAAALGFDFLWLEMEHTPQIGRASCRERG